MIEIRRRFRKCGLCGSQIDRLAVKCKKPEKLLSNSRTVIDKAILRTPIDSEGSS